MADPTRIDSQTKVLNDAAIVSASSIFDAYCRIDLTKIEIGVAEDDGTSNLDALIVTARPCVFMPETTPNIPGQVTDT